MAKSYFITGTDTGVGKSQITAALLYKAQQQGLIAIASKPVASGSFYQNGVLRNDDALLLQRYNSLQLSYDEINPLCYQPPIAPYLAAQLLNTTIDVQEIHNHYHALQKLPASLYFMEGIGGWLQPLTDTDTLADVVIALKLPVIMVVGIRLGCINHSLLTAMAIAQHTKISAWVANIIDTEMLYPENVITMLEQRFNFPCLGIVPYLTEPTPENIAPYLTIPLHHVIGDSL